jgi:alpha-glucosidase
MLDLGYAIADFCAIDPLFGSFEDFDTLVERLHGCDMRLILDFVPNHTSDLHPWFVESRASRAGPKRAWYVWADAGPNGGPPNNWLSRFGGSAWQWDEETEQSYYHSFLIEQPDLNWGNPEVREAMAKRRCENQELLVALNTMEQPRIFESASTGACSCRPTWMARAHP